MRLLTYICALILVLTTGCGFGPIQPSESTGKVTAASQAAAQEDGLCEHGVLQVLCPKCNPALASVFKTRGDWCEEHGFPESVCPIHHPERGGKPSVEVEEDEGPADGTKVVLKHAAVAQLVGLSTTRAVPGRGIAEIVAPAVISYDSSRMAQVNARSSGAVKRIHVEVGELVSAGSPLATIESATVGAEQSRFNAARSRELLAEANYRREKSLAAKGISPQADVSAAEQEWRVAVSEREALAASLGVVKADSKNRGQYTLSAPISGVVTQRNVFLNRFVDSQETLFEIVDTSTMVAEVAVPEQALAAVKIETPVIIRLGRLEGPQFTGKIFWIASYVDVQTRTAKARVRLANGDGTLKANMWCEAILQIGTTQSSVAIPRDAVQRAKTVQVAFVSLAPGEYETRRVLLARNQPADGLVEISSGINPGDEVVVDGSYFLKTETLKDSIGAGCCEIDNKK